MTMRRKKMSRKASRRNFKKYAVRTHKKNNRHGGGYAMRGGIRL